MLISPKLMLSRSTALAAFGGALLFAVSAPAEPTAAAGSDSTRRVGAASDALPGLERVGLVDASAPAGGVAWAATLGYGLTEAQPAETGVHQRASARIATAVTPLPWLATALVLDGRYDRHPKDARGRDDGWVLDPRLALRAGGELAGLALGVELVGSLPGSERISSSFDAASLDSKLLLGYNGDPVSVGSFAGFRLDRSSAAGKNAAALRPGDRLALGLSDYDAVLSGLGAAYRVQRTLVLAELSWDALVGQGAPPLRDSPSRATLGIRQSLGHGLSLEALAESVLSARPPLTATAPLIPIEPRFTFLVGLRYRSGEAAPTPTRGVPAAPERQAAPEPAVVAPKPNDTEVSVAVEDDAGAPLQNAKVKIQLGEQAYELTPDESGRYRAEHVPFGKGKLSIQADGRKPVERDIDVSAQAPLKLEIRTEQALPSGQVRGSVRSFAGKALAAMIRVEPGGQHTATDAQGFFQVDVPPGKYNVVVEAPGYQAQQRSVEVEKDGVVILNADLLPAKGR